MSSAAVSSAASGFSRNRLPILSSDEISDAVFRLDDLRGDLPALEIIFSAV
jgi:hypothetical protein